MTIKERVCTKHQNESKTNSVLRYESAVNICPLCTALEADKPEGDWVSAQDLVEAQSETKNVQDLLDDANNSLEESRVLNKSEQSSSQAHKDALNDVVKEGAAWKEKAEAGLASNIKLEEEFAAVKAELDELKQNLSDAAEAAKDQGSAVPDKE